MSTFVPYLPNPCDRHTQNLIAAGYRGVSTCSRCGVREDAKGPGHACGQCADRAFENRVRANPGAMAVYRDRVGDISGLEGYQIDTRKHAAWEAACDYHRRGGK